MSQGSRYQKVNTEEDKRRGPKPRKNFDINGGVNCKGCFELRNKNNELQEEIIRLRSALASPQKTLKKEKYFGCVSTKIQ